PVPFRSRSGLAVAATDPRAEVGEAAARAKPRAEELYANLVPLTGFPERLYIAPATCATYKQAWAILRKGAKGHVSAAWVLHEKNIYSIEDPADSRLGRIADADAVESHLTKEWAFSDDPDKRRMFVQLVNACLRDDLGALGIRFFFDDDVFVFAGAI